MKYKKSVYRSLALITQFGINMLVPIFLCVALGVYLGDKFGINWITIPLFAVGALAGFRNIFIMAKKIYAGETHSGHSSISEKEKSDETFSRRPKE
ncbi:MAG: AtpZ/AtpI family protein [Lachnospiraceae bacterium]|nr:AtpZ/AtpI family protein [Lachnospiraceae bacterium]